MLFHRKLRTWLPPGGHVEPHELPDDAAVREVREETGLDVELVGPRGLDGQAGRQLIRPEGIQVEEIAPGHEHIDLVYFARPRAEASPWQRASAEVERVGWYTVEDLAALDTPRDVVLWAERAVDTLAGSRAGPRAAPEPGAPTSPTAS